MNIQAIGVLGKRRIEMVVRTAEELVRWLRERDVKCLVEEELAAESAVLPSCPREEMPDRIDLLVVLGGDGTLLSAARLLAGSPVPLLGVNAGGLGFLTEVTMDELFPVLEKTLQGDVAITPRKMLEAVVVRSGNRTNRHQVLNDVVVTKGALARIIDMETYIDDQYLTTFKADGLIISSPTGSTAYNLSAGGPLVHHDLGSITLTPICPHTLTNRPIILPDNVSIRISVGAVKDETFLTFDGQVGYQAEAGDQLEVRTADDPLYLVKSPHRSFFQVLRSKLRWGER